MKIVKANPTDYTGEILPKVKQYLTDVLQLDPVRIYFGIADAIQVPKQQIITVFSSIIEFKPEFLVEFDVTLAKLIEVGKAR